MNPFPAPRDSLDADAIAAALAALPPPTAQQAADHGWTRDWSAAWASHETKLRTRGAAFGANDPAAFQDAWRAKPDVAPDASDPAVAATFPALFDAAREGAKHVTHGKERASEDLPTPSRQGRVQWFDFTGGAIVRAAKKRAIEDQRAHQIRVVEEVRRSQGATPETKKRDSPNVVEETRKINQPRATLRTGATIPLIGLGTWKSEPGKVRAAVTHALKRGYAHVDCASVYENEGEVGDALRGVFDSTTLLREDVFITSKLWNSDHAADRVEPACKKSMDLLKVRYLDLYLVHWPVTGNRGAAVTPSIEETWRAMEALVDEGLVRAIGVSNFSAEKMEAISKYARHPISVCQVECHPYWRQTELVKYCEANDIHVTAYSPLGSPDSAAMFKRDAPALMSDPVVIAAAERAGKNVGQTLVRWALQTRPNCSVLPKSTDPARIEGNLDVLDWSLDEEDARALSELPTRRRMVDGSFWLSPLGPYKTLEDLWDGP